MTTIHISNFRKNLVNTVENVIDFDEPVTVATNKGNIVIVSESSYNSMIETLYLTEQKGFVAKIKEGENESLSSMKKYNQNEAW